ncbi:MAG: aldehyde ferredoxin oxidoreductase, partial [Deltaproteobacteria bacterium]|nr:aldehyde ferredoxin oxidoreductase [Deltaproteobacteria bacterium]
MPGGCMGRILWVDLDTGEIRREAVEDRVYEEVLSGVGLGARILYSRIPRGAEPLGPDNVLAFVSGLLTGTGSVLTGRFTVCGKSPLTGGWGEANCGGFFSPAMKRAGVDGIFFRGIADRPRILVVDGAQARLEDAGDLWGMDCVAAEDALKARLPEQGGKWQVACIGPGGERLSLIAGISTDRGRFAARSGLGAVMGSKRLKAIAVRGAVKIPVADKDAVTQLSREFSEGLQKGDAVMKILGNRVFRFLGKVGRHGPVMRQPADAFRLILRKYGTSGLTTFSAENGDSPVKNFSGVGYRDFPMRLASKIGDDAVIRYEIRKYGCYSCPIKCGGIVAIPGGPNPVEECHKPEYETLCAFGTLCLVDDLETILRINDLCNRAGLDTISTGTVCAFAIECFERGVLSEADTGGRRLAWGDAAALLWLVERIAAREGIGDILADGVRVASRRIGKGSEAWAMHAGGQELPMHDPRFDTSYGISYQCDPTPGRHTVAAATWSDLML